MHIDWSALLIVAVVSIVASVVFVALLSAGIRVLVGPAGHRTQKPLGFGLLGVAGLLVLYGLYLIVPQLH